MTNQPQSEARPRRIVLTGFMGSGKTTVGPLLAARLGWKFIDADDVIEAEAGAPIAELFARNGEARFRDLEHATITRLCAANDALVLHTGGTDQVTGFDLSAGDTLNLSALFAEAQIGGDVPNLAAYIAVTNDNGAAAISFDPTGQGGGSTVAVLAGDGGLVAQLQTMKAFSV